VAAAWLALCVFKDPNMYDAYIPLFYGFSAIRRKVWNDRNIHLAASAKAASAQESAKASRISAMAAKETYTSAVPGTIKHALEKQRQKQATGSKATKGKADVMEQVLVEGYDLTNARVSGGTGCLTGAGTGRG